MEKLSRSKCGKRKGDHEGDEDSFYKHMKEHYLKKSQAREDQDGDYMVMVSLVPELKKVPQEHRLKVNSSIINLLLDAQQYHSRPTTNPSPGFVQPSVPTTSGIYGTHCYGGHESLQHQVGSSHKWQVTVDRQYQQSVQHLNPRARHGHQPHQPQGQGEEHFSPAASFYSDYSLFSTKQ
ncbi:hypothetical protein PR048_009017 [Dryococelus australis]|uniref:BESS domain-containing protein n=1 Tax=Dryococelus australis TaxID=614101 RepID=A0ABQ9HYQ6_9NEOP|nr:hypothetical protein PR048_009017 [Dryococelus australis]